MHVKLIQCTQLLNERFIAAWTRDGFKDYLDMSTNKPVVNGENLLNRLLQSSANGSPTGV